MSNRSRICRIFRPVIPAILIGMAAIMLAACPSPAEKAAGRLAERLVPGYRISFQLTKDTVETYRFWTQGGKLVIEGSSTSAMAVGLNRYLNDYCHTTVSWYAADPVEVPETMPAVTIPVSGKALVKDRFFLNYCTFGYTMPWWQWEDWERLIDWMAVQGVNLPLACTGQEAVWQDVWREFGLSDDEIRSYFTGPAHLPWHRMCNIDGVDGPLPQGWIDGQEALQRQILQRERELGMHPVLPAFAGHVPARLKELFPDARITDAGTWGGFPETNACHFLSPEDSLYGRIQQAFLKAQESRFGTDHVYGFDLFNEIPPPSWEPEVLARIGRAAYESVAETDPKARWIQMGWLFYYDRKDWTPERIQAYLEAIPQGRVTLLDYYTENIPVWELTERFYGQPYIFCYLGNFGGNTRLAGPFRKESGRITEALERGGADGIGCTLEGFGVNQWFYEYVMGRAWQTGVNDDQWLANLDERQSAPDGFWKEMADSIYLRGSFSEGPLVCGRPCEEGFQHWTVVNHTPYGHATLERLWKRLQEHPGASPADLVILGTQVLGNRFATLRDDFVKACREKQTEKAADIGQQMKELLLQIDSLAGTRSEFRAEDWLDAASAWGRTPQEKQYYRDNAWHLLTVWGISPNLNDYANRLWSGLIRAYYLPRWELFIRMHLDCLTDRKPYDSKEFDRACRELELRLSAHAPAFKEISLMTFNTGNFSKYSENSLPEAAKLIRDSGASLVSLNELDSCNRRHGFFQLEALADSLSWSAFHFARAFPFAGGAYGNGVLSFEPVQQTFTIPLTQSDGAEPRSAAVVETESCVFASTHLDHVGKEARLLQAKTLNDWFRTHYGGCGKPVFLCGDMNAQPDSETLAILQEEWILLSGTGLTYSTTNPIRCIDYILAFKDAAPVRTLHSQVLTEGTAGLSDHFPVLVKAGY